MSKMSFNAIRELICTAICAAEGASFNCYIVDIYPDYVVYESCGMGPDCVEKYYQRPYSISNDVVTLGAATEVKREVSYQPIKAACQILTAVEGDESGNLWNVCILQYGLSVDGRLLFTRERMSAAVAQFEGAKLFALRSGQHQDAAKHGKPPVDIIGVITKPEARADGIYGQVVFLPTGYGIRDNLKAARDMGVSDPYGLSVDIDAKAAVINIKGKKVMTPLEIHKVTVDVVYDPAAGGQFLQMAAAYEAGRKGDQDMFEKLMAAIKGKRSDLHTQITAGIEAGTMTEADAVQLLAAAITEEAGTADTAGNTQIAAAVAASLQSFLSVGAGATDETKILACEMRLDRALSDSGLPLPSQKNLRETFNGKIFAAVELDSAIKAKKEELDALVMGTGLVIEAGHLRASVTEDQQDKHAARLDDFFTGKVQSFKACYQDITGDTRITGQLRDAVKFQASIVSTGFTEMLGDSIARRMVAEYNASGLSDWKKICTVVPLADFRTQRRPRMGGYGDLPAVAQSGLYGALASPLDEESTYAASKRGGTEDITLEAIKNDDIGMVRRIPQKLGRAGARTLYKFVFDFLATNAVVYDALALFVAGHNNLGVAALAKATLQANRLAMMKQTEQGSAEPLGIGPRYLVVPLDLADLAYELTAQPNLAGFMPTVSDSIKNQTWEIIPVKTWVDINNWYTVADPADIPTIEIGFLDGKEEPELFVQDLPSVGSMFSNDRITYKIRHIYGGAVEDFRGFQGNIVP
ncbi:MAG: hypothetical protein H7Y05_14985 [Steroidobacteraceae bacterium]|nr:hypothetical protein [Deltaproteobacteria bacterium]